MVSIDSGPCSDDVKIGSNHRRKEQLVKQLLVKVKKRRKMNRSYTYLIWSCFVFSCFLAHVNMKEVLILKSREGEFDNSQPPLLA